MARKILEYRYIQLQHCDDSKLITITILDIINRPVFYIIQYKYI
jgi:hypothetical protein